MIRRFTHKVAFELFRRDMAFFLQEHEEDLIQAFRDEMKQIDIRTPEETMYIDIKMEPLGEAIMRAALRAFDRFLKPEEFESDLPAIDPPGPQPLP